MWKHFSEIELKCELPDVTIPICLNTEGMMPLSTTGGIKILDADTSSLISHFIQSISVQAVRCSLAAVHCCIFGFLWYMWTKRVGKHQKRLKQKLFVRVKFPHADLFYSYRHYISLPGWLRLTLFRHFYFCANEPKALTNATGTHSCVFWKHLLHQRDRERPTGTDAILFPGSTQSAVEPQLSSSSWATRSDVVADKCSSGQHDAQKYDNKTLRLNYKPTKNAEM